MPFMRCPTCKHTDHATGTEALPCTNPNGCRGIMEPEGKRPAAEYGPSHLAERHAWQAEARARAEVNELAAATSGTPTNDSMDGRVVLPPAARAMLDAAATSSVTTEAEQAAALEAARRHEALVGQNRDHCDERCPPPSATLEISVGGDRVDVREVSDDGAVPLATRADLEAARAQLFPDGSGELPEIAPQTDPAHPHLVDGEFQSDKYPTCPRGKVPLSCKDPHAQDLLWLYAQRHEPRDPQFSADLRMALDRAGFVPHPSASTHDQAFHVGVREGEARAAAKRSAAKPTRDQEWAEYEALEAAYWRMDALRSGDAKECRIDATTKAPMAERDAFKRAVRELLGQDAARHVSVHRIEIKADNPDRFAFGLAADVATGADLDRLAELVGIKRGGAARSSETDAALRVRVRDEIVRMAAQPLEAQSALGNAGEHMATHEDGLRAGCLAAIEQVNTILDQLVEVADLCCEPDRTLGEPGEHQRAALIADVVRIVRRRLQDVGV